jgi:hypothetical protein
MKIYNYPNLILILNLPFEAEARLNNIWEFSPYLKENTTLRHYKDQLVNAVYGNIDAYNGKHQKYAVTDHLSRWYIYLLPGFKGLIGYLLLKLS